MNDKQKKLDEIDRQLFMLRDRAYDIGEPKLAMAIGAARSISYSLLPAARKSEFK